MDVKLRDYVIEEKMKVTSEEVRAFLYIFLMCPRKSNKKLKLANSAHEQDTINLNKNSFD